MFDKIKTFILKAKAFVDGYKTYTTAGAGIATAAVAWASGAMDTQTFAFAVWNGLMAIFVRLGVSKSGPK